MDTVPAHGSRSVLFDMRGFKFALVCLFLLALAFSGIRYGVAYAADYMLSDTEEKLAATELRLAEIKAKRTMRSLKELEFHKKFREYETTLATRTIGTASIDTLRLAHEKMVGADLSTMTLYLYEKGEPVAEYPILSKGRRGSQWETPTGLYEIELKLENHFSSIGQVYMPYSMQFFGNFFIHGWPYYPGGEPVEEGFSGGCIRLSTDDAQAVFAFADTQTPIFIWDAGSAETADVALTERALPPLSASAFLVADVATGEVYAERSADKKHPIASLTKLVTALVANETIHYGRTITVSAEDRMQTEGTPGALLANDTFTVGDLLYALIMESNNAVSYSLARYFGQNTFVEWMNDKARAIGMTDTALEDPSGISEHNVSTASDLFRLARYIHDSQSFVLNMSRQPKKTITAENGRRYSLNNFNHFSGVEGFLGGKTGFTEEAGQTMLTVFEIPVGEQKATIAIIVLDSKNRKSDVEKLLAWFTRSARSEPVAITSSPQ